MEQQKIQEFLNRINTTKIKDINIEQDIEILKEIMSDWEDPESKSNNDTKVAEFYALRVFFHKYACQLYGNNTPAKFMEVNARDANHYNSVDSTIYYQRNAIATKETSITLIFQALHENRHAVQFSQFKKRPEDILTIDPLSIVMLKELYLKSYHNELYGQYHNNFIIENDASLCAEVQLRHIISQYLDSNPKYFEELNRNSNKENKNYNTVMQHAESNANLRFNTSEFGVLPVLYQADKDLKDHINIRDIREYPLLQLICKEDGTLKTYEEIVKDRERHKLEHAEEQSVETISSNTEYERKSFSNNTQIDRIYQFIINSDPMLYMEDCLSNNRTSQLEELFVDAPDVICSYSNKIIELVSKYGTLENYKRFMTYYKEEQNNLKQERAKIISQIGNLIKENKQHPIKDYQEQIDELVRRKDNITNALEQVSEGLNYFNLMVSMDDKECKTSSQAIITNGVEATEERTKSSQINKEIDNIHQQEEQNRSLADLDEFIDFIDPQLIQDSRFLAFFRKYMPSLGVSENEKADFIERIERNYRNLDRKDNIDNVEETDEIEAPR